MFLERPYKSIRINLRIDLMDKWIDLAISILSCGVCGHDGIISRGGLRTCTHVSVRIRVILGEGKKADLRGGVRQGPGVVSAMSRACHMGSYVRAPVNFSVTFPFLHE